MGTFNDREKRTLSAMADSGRADAICLCNPYSEHDAPTVPYCPVHGVKATAERHTVYSEFALGKSGLFADNDSDLMTLLKTCLRLSPTGRALVMRGEPTGAVKYWEQATKAESEPQRCECCEDGKIWERDWTGSEHDRDCSECMGTGIAQKKTAQERKDAALEELLAAADQAAVELTDGTNYGPQCATRLRAAALRVRKART